jgi:hypothetical protein
MTEKAYVYSTLSCDNMYREWVPSGANEIPQAGRDILVKGGTGIANDRIVTPLGVRTEIDADAIPILKANASFKLHEKNGFVLISSDKRDPEVMAADMQRGDGGSPLSPLDIAKTKGAQLHGLSA